MKVQLLINGVVAIEEDVPLTNLKWRLTQLQKYGQGLLPSEEWELVVYRRSKANCGGKSGTYVLTTAQIQQAGSLKRMGFSNVAIGIKLGVSAETIRMKLKQSA